MNAINENIGSESTGEIAANAGSAGSAGSAGNANLNAPVNVLVDETAIDSIKKAATNGKMRNVYSSFDSAIAAFQKGSAEAEKHGVPSLFNAALFFEMGEDGEVKLDSEGNPIMLSQHAEGGSRFAVAVVGARKKTGNKIESGIRALVIFPVPSLAQFIAGGESWLAKIAEKEAAHVAFRGLRNATTLAELEAANSTMPNDVDGYIASYNSGDGLDTETIDAVWSDVRKFIKSEASSLYGLMPPKQEVIKAIRSASYAMQEHPELEKRGLFTNVIAALVIKAAENWKDGDGNEAPLEVDTIQGWIDNRDTTHIAQRQTAEKDFSVLDGFDLNI